MQTLPLVDHSKRMATLFIMINDEQLRKMLTAPCAGGERRNLYCGLLRPDHQRNDGQAKIRCPFGYADMQGNQGKLEAGC